LQKYSIEFRFATISLKYIKMAIQTIFFYASLVLISIINAMAGGMKIRGQEPMKSRMEEMNHGGFLMLLIGVLEVLGVIGLWIPVTRPLALICLLPFSIGGLAAHQVLRHDFKERSIPAVLVIILTPLALYLDPSFQIFFK
jgi:uncharacterized membrane protein YphA (DoxX/SURF4 family)